MKIFRDSLADRKRRWRASSTRALQNHLYSSILFELRHESHDAVRTQRDDVGWLGPKPNRALRRLARVEPVTLNGNFATSNS
jgi:hypothetical protein